MPFVYIPDIPFADNVNIITRNATFHPQLVSDVELSCSFEKNIEKANILKTKRYLDIKTDLENSGWKSHLVPFEIGSRGQVTKQIINFQHPVTESHKDKPE